MNTQSAVDFEAQTGHVGLNVSDLNRSLPFYRDVFGLEVLRHSDKPDQPFAWLGREGDILVTLWEQSEGVFPSDRPGLHHLAFEVESLEGVKQARERLRDRDVTFLHDGELVLHDHETPSGGIFFEDPDGLRLEIYAPQGVQTEGSNPEEGPACGFF